MRISALLHESFHTAFQNGDRYVEVFRNPGRDEAFKLIAQAEAEVLRFWLVSTGLYVWDAMLSTHDVDFDLGHDGQGAAFSGLLDRDGVIVNHPEMFSDDLGTAMACFQKPELEHIYGRPVPVRFDGRFSDI